MWDQKKELNQKKKGKIIDTKMKLLIICFMFSYPFEKGYLQDSFNWLVIIICYKRIAFSLFYFHITLPDPVTINKKK